MSLAGSRTRFLIFNRINKNKIEENLTEITFEPDHGIRDTATWDMPSLWTYGQSNVFGLISRYITIVMLAFVIG